MDCSAIHLETPQALEKAWGLKFISNEYGKNMQKSITAIYNVYYFMGALFSNVLYFGKLHHLLSNHNWTLWLAGLVVIEWDMKTEHIAQIDGLVRQFCWTDHELE